MLGVKYLHHIQSASPVWQACSCCCCAEYLPIHTYCRWLLYPTAAHEKKTSGTSAAHCCCCCCVLARAVGPPTMRFLLPNKSITLCVRVVHGSLMLFSATPCTLSPLAPLSACCWWCCCWCYCCCCCCCAPVHIIVRYTLTSSFFQDFSSRTLATHS